MFTTTTTQPVSYHTTLAQRANFALAHGTKPSGLGTSKLVAPAHTLKH